MKCAHKGDQMFSVAGEARELQRRFDGFRPGVRKKYFLRSGPRSELREFLREPRHRFIVEIAAADMQKLSCLFLDRLNDLRMRMPRARHRDSGHEIEEKVPVNILDNHSATFLDHQ